MSPAPIRTAAGSAKGPAVAVALGEAGDGPPDAGTVADAARLGQGDADGATEVAAGLGDSVALGIDHPQAAMEAATTTAASSRRVCSGLITPDLPA